MLVDSRDTLTLRDILSDEHAARFTPLKGFVASCQAVLVPQQASIHLRKNAHQAYFLLSEMADRLINIATPLQQNSVILLPLSEKSTTRATWRRRMTDPPAADGRIAEESVIFPEYSRDNCAHFRSEEMGFFMKATSPKKQGSKFSWRDLAAFICIAATLVLLSPRNAAALTITPSTWNIIGLDSNAVNVGPNLFPVGAKVCGGTSGSTVNVYFEWQSANVNINLRPGSKGDGGTPLDITFGADGCADAFFEVQVSRTAAAYDTSRKYRIYAGSDSTPTPRELYVEHLISQARNAITNVKVDGVSIPAGGSMNLVVGNTYTIDLIGGTATQGYNQFSSFFTLSNTIFQVISVTSTYSANNSPYVPDPIYGSGLYADACKWDSDPGSPTYRSCIGGDYKAGGSPVTATYKIKIIGGGGSSITLSSLMYDFSGSSYHYNGDYSTGARIANIIDPASAGIAKTFSPATTDVGGVSTLTFTLTNPNEGALSGLGFTDIFPASPGAMTLYDTVTSNTCGGTLTNSLGGALTAGDLGIRLSGGTVAANGSCMVQVNVTTDTTGSYTNTSQNLLVNTLNTGKNATATLTVNSTPPPPAPPSSCTSPVELARWIMDPSQGTGTPPLYFSKDTDVATATASFTGGTNAISTGQGNPVNSWGGTGWAATPGTTFPSATTAPWFDFVLDTSKYGGARVTFDYAMKASGDWQGPSDNRIYVYTSANGGAFSTVSATNATKNAWQTGANGVTANAATTGTSTTTFRVNATGAGKPAAAFYLDNIVFTGCPTPTPPTITKSFATNPVAVGGTSVLTFTITNPNACCALSGIAFADILPLNSLQGTVAVTNASPTVTGIATAFNTQLVAGSVIYINKTAYTVLSIASDTQLTLTANYAAATTSGLTITSGLTLTGAPPTTTCTGGTTSTSTDATTGATVISLADGSIVAGAGTTCTVTATVKDSIAGPISNVSGAVTATESGTNSGVTGVARASLTAVLPPIISKRFAQNPILSGGTSTLTFLISNPNQNDILNGVAFTDTFPATMLVKAPATYTTSGCGAPTFTPVAGANNISFSAGTITGGGTCTVTVNVTATTTATNTSGAVSATTAGTGNTATDTLTIAPPRPVISMFKEIASSNTPTTIWSYYLALTVGGSVYYQLQVQNDGDVPLTSVTVSDPQLTIPANCWQDGDGTPLTPPFTLQVPNAANNADFATCTIGPITVSSPGALTNTATGEGFYSGTQYTDTDYAIYATTGLTLAKSVTQSYFTAAGNTLNYGYLVTNSGFSSLNGPLTVSDDKATVICPAVNSVGDLDNYFDPGESMTCTTSYTVTAADVTAKSVTNTASASTPSGGNIAGAISNTDSRTVPLAADLTAIKTNNVGGTVYLGNSFDWVLSVVNSAGAGSAAFLNGQALLTDDLPASGAAYSLGAVTGAGMTGTVICAIAANTLTCTASGAVTLPPALSGTVAVTNGNAVVTGSGTTFTTQLTTGSVIVINGAPYTVLSVQNDTQLTLTAIFTGATASGLTIPTSFSVPVTVTPGTAGSLVNPRGGGICRANPVAVIPEIDQTNNGCATNTVTVANLPSLTVIKSVQTVSDPVNGTTSPKIIPGSVMQYTVQVINSGAGSTDAGTMVVNDAIPADTIMCVANVCSNPPVAFACSSTPSCGLSYSYGNDVTYSNQAGGGAPYSYLPSPDANGFDANVTGVRINPTGSFNGASGGNNSTFSLIFKVKVK